MGIDHHEGKPGADPVERIYNSLDRHAEAREAARNEMINSVDMSGPRARALVEDQDIAQKLFPLVIFDERGRLAGSESPDAAAKNLKFNDSQEDKQNAAVDYLMWRQHIDGYEKPANEEMGKLTAGDRQLVDDYLKAHPKPGLTADEVKKARKELEQEQPTGYIEPYGAPSL